jgi:hypothetical protein
VTKVTLVKGTTGDRLDDMTTVQDRLNWIHSLFQELETQGVELPMGDYNYVYDMIETIRDNHTDGWEWTIGVGTQPYSE